MIKKLCSYCLNCVIETQKSESLINLKKNKFCTEKEKKKLIELKTIQKLNNSTMILYYCGKYYINNSPFFYKEYEKKEEDFKINIGLILKHFENFELLEMFLNEINEIKEEEEIIKILKNYIDVEIEKKENYIILSYIQEAKAGLIKELKYIVNNC